MAEVSLYDYASLSAEGRAALLKRSEADLSGVIEKVKPIIEAVRTEGDAALARFARDLDKSSVSEDQIQVTPAEFDAAFKGVDAKVVEAIQFGIENIRSFHEEQKPETMWMKEIRPGAFAGDRFTPIQSVALYVPRGKGSFPSVTMMTSVPAVVAGVPNISIVTPPAPDGSVDAATLVAARLAQVRTRGVEVAPCPGRLRQLAVVVRDRLRLRRIRDARHLAVDRDRAVPVPLDLVDAHEVLERRDAVGSRLGQLQQQLLGAVHQARAQVVLRQRIGGLLPVRRVEVVAQAVALEAQEHQHIGPDFVIDADDADLDVGTRERRCADEGEQGQQGGAQPVQDQRPPERGNPRDSTQSRRQPAGSRCCHDANHGRWGRQSAFSANSVSPSGRPSLS